MICHVLPLSVTTITSDIAGGKTHFTCLCFFGFFFLGELTALKQFLGDRDLGSDEQQQVDGDAQQLFILELIHLNQVRVSQLQRLRHSEYKQTVDTTDKTQISQLKSKYKHTLYVQMQT